ncbi:MAG: helix-turn-helix domain-containing protein [Clostridia bacterium]|nr:helix-turn-helix domain-containing protein [Clostridia bacterium]
MNELCNLIRTARQKKGLKQKEVAEQINMSTASYSRIETGVCRPSMESLRNICRVLDLSFSDAVEISGYAKYAITRIKREIYQELGMEQLMWELERLSKQDLELVMELLKAVSNLTQKDKDTIKFILSN